MGRRAASPITRRRPALILSAIVAAVATAATLTVSANAAEDPGSPETKQDCGGGTYNAEVVQDGSTWTAPGYTGDSMPEAVRAGIASLTEGRTSIESVVVRGSGDIGSEDSIDIPSYTSIEICGTINVVGEIGAEAAPLRMVGVNDVAVPYLEGMTGAPYFGIFVRNASNVDFGQINMTLSGGLGMRIDNHDDTSWRTNNVTIDSANISGAGSHAIETYGVDGLTIGTVTATDVGESGLLIQDTYNAEIGSVIGENVASGTGYATFRMANRNGALDDYSTNIHVGEVVARGGGRGIFCVSESGGAVIDRVDISDTENNAILIENCYNVTIAAESGTVSGGGEIRLAARSEFANNRDITLSNLTVINSAVTEDPCGENTVIENVTFENSADNTC
ncbi:right-handed parallel beta-helix repeat-containing protein [Streptomyces sp. 6N223]|uniref:right-handed parallel beta-helix repeat-containing protein n=1 Tax=Streptomyces sp. 6N223 TaxID=3457412 RepID=UPI003FD33263